MKITYKKEINLKIGQEVYGIVGVSRFTYSGVRRLRVYYIDWNENSVGFIDQDTNTIISGHFEDLGYYIFETKEEAEAAYENLEWGLGLM